MSEEGECFLMSFEKLAAGERTPVEVSTRRALSPLFLGKLRLTMRDGNSLECLRLESLDQLLLPDTHMLGVKQ